MNNAQCYECGATGVMLTSVAVPKGKGVGLAVCPKCVKLPEYQAHVRD